MLQKTGEKLPIFIIGDSKKQDSLKTSKTYCVIIGPKKRVGWTLFFEEYAKKIDSKFQKDGRNVAMIIDNCQHILRVDGLKAMELKRLPPSTTLHTQPMDQGVIR